MASPSDEDRLQDVPSLPVEGISDDHPERHEDGPRAGAEGRDLLELHGILLREAAAAAALVQHLVVGADWYRPKAFDFK